MRIYLTSIYYFLLLWWLYEEGLKALFQRSGADQKDILIKCLKWKPIFIVLLCLSEVCTFKSSLNIGIEIAELS